MSFLAPCADILGGGNWGEFGSVWFCVGSEVYSPSQTADIGVSQSGSGGIT